MKAKFSIWHKKTGEVKEFDAEALFNVDGDAIQGDVYVWGEERMVKFEFARLGNSSRIAGIDFHALWHNKTKAKSEEWMARITNFANGDIIFSQWNMAVAVGSSESYAVYTTPAASSHAESRRILAEMPAVHEGQTRVAS